MYNSNQNSEEKFRKFKILINFDIEQENKNFGFNEKKKIKSVPIYATFCIKKWINKFIILTNNMQFVIMILDILI